MCNLVKKYGGFYIARFEAGDADVTEDRTGNTEAHTVVSKKGAIVYNMVPWGESVSSIGTTGAVYLSKNMYKGHGSVVSTLCYGVQWDAALNFVSDAEHNIVESSSWGNYTDVSVGTPSLQKTGANEAWKAKNIYDLAGNAFEWTMECSYNPDDEFPIGNRVARGGFYFIMPGNSIPASYRAGTIPTVVDYGFRVALYLK